MGPTAPPPRWTIEIENSKPKVFSWLTDRLLALDLLSLANPKEHQFPTMYLWKIASFSKVKQRDTELNAIEIVFLTELK